jgi:hypothetical protein
MPGLNTMTPVTARSAACQRSDILSPAMSHHLLGYDLVKGLLEVTTVQFSRKAEWTRTTLSQPAQKRTGIMASVNCRTTLNNWISVRWNKSFSPWLKMSAVLIGSLSGFTYPYLRFQYATSASFTHNFMDFLRHFYLLPAKRRRDG